MKTKPDSERWPCKHCDGTGNMLSITSINGYVNPVPGVQSCKICQGTGVDHQAKAEWLEGELKRLDKQYREGHCPYEYEMIEVQERVQKVIDSGVLPDGDVITQPVSMWLEGLFKELEG